MDTEIKTSYKILFIGLSALVVFLQFQATLTVFNNDLRLSISDLLLPVVLLCAYWNINFDDLALPTWHIRWLPILFLIFSLWLGVSFIQGYLHYGFSIWALVNKFLGWFILLGYFFAGSICGLFSQGIQKNILNGLIVVSWVISFFSFLIFIFMQAGFYIPYCVDNNACYRICGFLENPNAFGLLCTFVLLIQLPILEKKIFISPRINYVGALLNMLALVCTISRTAVISLMIGCLILVFRKKQLLFRMVSLGTLACVIMMLSMSGILLKVRDRLTPAHVSSVKSDASKHYNGQMYSLKRIQGVDDTTHQRIDSLRFAYQLWKKNPVVGVGLGGFLAQEEQLNVMPKLSLHNTAMWLLTETGLVGIGLILILFFASFYVINKNSRIPDEHPFALSGIAVLVAFALASMTAEIMYQRYLWFFLGLLLVHIQKPNITRAGS